MSNNIKTAAESARNFISGLLNKVTGTGQDSAETTPKSNDPTKENVKIVGDREIKDAPVEPKPAPTQEKSPNAPINNNSGNQEVKDLPKPPTKENQPKIEVAKRPIPVKINESDILMEGTVKSYVENEWRWIETNLKLTVDGVLTKDDQPIEISPMHEVGPSRIVNVPGAFNLDIDNESDWKPGHLFAAAAVADGEKWIRCLDYARYHKINASKHEHPLDEFSRSTPCRICSKKPKKDSFYSDGLTCMFCKEGEYEICTNCHPKLQECPKDLLITTPHHPHKLMAFDRPSSLHPFSGAPRLGPAKLDSTVLPCNNCGQNITGRMYYCPRCDYAECLACAPVSNQPDQAIGSAPMELVVGYLKDYVKSDKTNHFKLSVNEGQRAPDRMALVSNRPWNVSQIDASPALDAYFEVTIEQFEEGEHIAVGVGNQIFQQNKQLGNQQNSFGYWNNGKVSMNTVYSSEEGYGQYGAGDTIGVGMMLDSYNDRKLFFTKNGQFIKSFENRVHRGMDCFPGVSFTKDSKVEFAVNFTGPFKFDVNSVPDYRTDRSCRLGAAPTEVVAQIFYFAAETPMQAAEWQRLSKKVKEAASHNIVWKDLYLRKFPNQNPNLKIKSWMKFYKRRKDANKQKGPFGDKPVIIENCDFEFECPLIFDNLEQKDPNPQERFCNKCNKTVYQVYGEAQLKEYITMGRCVTLYSSKMRGGPGMPRMGSSPAPRPKIPKPF